MANDDASRSNVVGGDGEVDSNEEKKKPVVLITGCGKGGIGYEYCQAFSALGCRVVATDIPERAADLAEDDLAADVMELDVTSEESVAAAVARVMASHGRIDVLVNNAGIGCTGPLAELRAEAVRRAMDVNFLGQVRMVRAVAPHMAARRSGRVVNVGSVVGNAATPWAAPYCASKAAVHAATDALRLELRPFGVHVVKVVPGAVRSGLGRANAARLAHEQQHEEEQGWRMYGEFAAAIEERARASQSGRATDGGAFARHVARRVMSARPPREIVYGHMTLLFAALAASPAWVRDAFFTRKNENLKQVVLSLSSFFLPTLALRLRLRLRPRPGEEKSRRFWIPHDSQYTGSSPLPSLLLPLARFGGLQIFAEKRPLSLSPSHCRAPQGFLLLHLLLPNQAAAVAERGRPSSPRH